MDRYFWGHCEASSTFLGLRFDCWASITSVIVYLEIANRAALTEAVKRGSTRTPSEDGAVVSSDVIAFSHHSISHREASRSDALSKKLNHSTAFDNFKNREDIFSFFQTHHA